MNKVILKGNLTRDPELREVPMGDSSTQVANFTVAVSRYYKKKNGEREKATEYIDCEAWDSGAKSIGDLLSKGDPVLIEGSIKKDTWDDKETGQKRSRTKIRVETFDKLFRKSHTDEPVIVPDDIKNEPTPELVESVQGEDIPF